MYYILLYEAIAVHCPYCRIFFCSLKNKNAILKNKFWELIIPLIRFPTLELILPLIRFPTLELIPYWKINFRTNSPTDQVMWVWKADFFSCWTFFFQRTFCPSRRFVPPDILSHQSFCRSTFCPSGCFFPQTFCPFGRFSPGRFVTDRSVAGCCVARRFVWAPSIYYCRCSEKNVYMCTYEHKSSYEAHMCRCDW